MQCELRSALSPYAVFTAAMQSWVLTDSLLGGRAGILARDALAQHTQRVTGERQ